MVKNDLIASNYFIKTSGVQIDQITLKDLSIIDGAHSVFELINKTTSSVGAHQLKQFLMRPPADYEALIQQQEAVKFWLRHLEAWDTEISNGTLVMLKDFFEHADGLHYKPSSWLFAVDAALQKVFNKNAYSLLQFSVHHLIDLVNGLQKIVNIHDEHMPPLVQNAMQVFAQFLAQDASKNLLALTKQSSLRALLHGGYQARRSLKKYITSLYEQFALMDAWHAMAKAGTDLGFVMPVIYKEGTVNLQAYGLFHPLLAHPVPFDISFTQQKPMLFLTGANMSGKSTLLRSLGVSALLAHIGMPVPARQYEIGFLEGIITNMQVEDNIFNGESYFFAEVKRMKITAEKISKGSRQLVLMDELFKGTNVHDAYECSKAVIQNLVAHKGNLYALSTHLYELYEELSGMENIDFRYCNTNIDASGNFSFTYELKLGVSNDKIGYLVLQKEGVLDILKQQH
jgi:DNA mismatch repair protein MutS